MQITIEGSPVAKGRPKVSGKIYWRKNELTGRSVPDTHITVRTPKETRVEEERIRWKAKIAMGDLEPFRVPLVVKACFYVKVPSSALRSEEEGIKNGSIVPVVKPDLDNYVKLLLDAFNGIVYIDDSLIVDIEVSKRFSFEPRTVVIVEPLSWAKMLSAHEKSIERRLEGADELNCPE